MLHAHFYGSGDYAHERNADPNGQSLFLLLLESYGLSDDLLTVQPFCKEVSEEAKVFHDAQVQRTL